MSEKIYALPIGLLFALLILFLFIPFEGRSGFLRVGFGIGELTVLAQRHPPEWIFVGDRFGSFWFTFFDDLLMLHWNWNFGVRGLPTDWYWLRVTVLPIHIGAVKTGVEMGALGRTLSINTWGLYYVAVPMVYWFDSIGGSIALAFEWVRTDPRYWCVWFAVSAYVDIIGVLSHFLR